MSKIQVPTQHQTDGFLGTVSAVNNIWSGLIVLVKAIQRRLLALFN